MHWILALFRLVASVARRFHVERCTQTAAALSFATLLGLVPMFAVGAVLISKLPFGSGLGSALEKFLLTNLLPDKAGAVIAKYVAQFAHRAERVTLIGGLVLGLTALIQMLTIERAFNAIWKIREARPVLQRLAMHLVALLVGPLVFGGSLVAITYLASVSFGLLDEPRWVNTLFFKVVPFVFMAVLFALVYWAVPNRPIRVAHAVTGGLFAATGFMLMQRLFSLYVAKLPTYTVIYGAFAAMPVFLIWLAASWGIILVGALVTAELPHALARSSGPKVKNRG
ncbi:MAG: YihY family inner membrane protein [Gammaproteobacteria bacterium]|nr:YihY family inner membrane protein [Gammaproteobacteria bacterium]MBU1647099.1 YihY family inner membrane protein [Gammaproteobacteria bacterium]MBU1972611.1 YihY family inner membrane protein [Gammaproteobacteria bacterium]